MIINGVLITTEEELTVAVSGMDAASRLALTNIFRGIDNAVPQSAKDRDYQKYLKRADARDAMVAEMASENMERVRAGIWSVPDLIGLTQDPGLKEVLNDLTSLSFELAQQKVNGLTHPLVTPEIKTAWIMKLQRNLFNS